MAVTRGTSADLGDKSGTTGTFTTASFGLGSNGQKVIVVTTTENNGAGNQLVTGCSISGGASFSTAIHNAWGSFQTTNVFVLDTTTNGSVTFDLTYTGGANAGFHIQVVVYDGAGLNGGVVDSSNTATTTASNGLTTTTTVATANSFVVLTGVIFAGGIAASTGSTGVVGIGTSYGMFDSNVAKPAGSYSMDYTGNFYAGTLFGGIISLAPSSGGGGGTVASTAGRDFMLTGAF